MPSSIWENPIRLSNPLSLNKWLIEHIAKEYAQNKFKANDSTVLIGNFQIPIVIDYGAIVYGFPHQLRENKALVFLLHADSEDFKVEYSNSILINRIGYPVKPHTFTYLTKESLQNKIYRQDSIDIQDILNSQLIEWNRH